jgi:putative endonuclease
MSRQEAEARGRRGEWLAAWWLRLHGWSIVQSRVKLRMGEVDLIAKRRNVIAFVEVKTRSKAADLDFAIDPYKLRRVVAAAKALAPRLITGDEETRIDVILIAPWTWPRHMTNVWTG